jgi:hypothetical protein
LPPPPPPTPPPGPLPSPPRPAAAAPGGAFKVVVRLSLSRDARASHDDLVLGSAKPRKCKATARVRVPAAATGRYRLLACAGKRCRTAKGVLSVATIASPGTPSTD